MKAKKPEQKTPSELRKRAEEKLKSKITTPRVMSDKETRQLIHKLQVHQIELEMQNEELRKAQSELEESRSKYSDLYDFAPVSYFTFDKQGLILGANLTAAKELGIERSGLIKKPFRTYIVTEDKNIFDSHLQKVFKSDDRQTCEIRLKRKNGNEFYAQLESISANDLKGNSLCRTSVIDITEHKRVEEALHASEEKFRSLFESAHDALMTLEPPSWAFTSGNPATVAMFRAKNEENFISHAPWQVSPERQPDGRASGEKAKEMIETAMREGSHFFEWTHKRIDGEEFPATVLLTRIELAGRQFLQATVRDITELKRAEEELERFRHQYKLILQSAGEGILGLDLKGNHTFVNPSAAKKLGYEIEELIGQPSHLIWHHSKPDGTFYPREECPIYAAYKDGTIYSRDNEVFWRKDGTSFPVRYTSTPIREGDKLTGAVVVFRDITERKRAQELDQLRLNLIQYAVTHSSEDLLIKVLDEVEKLTGSEVSFYHVVGADQKTLTLRAWSTRTVRDFCKAEGKGMHYGIEQAGVWVDCVKQRKPVIHNDYASLLHRKGLPKGHTPVIRELVVPIFRQNEIVAILGVGNKQVDYTDDDIKIISYCADIAWGITQRKKAEEELRRSHDELEIRVQERTAELKKANRALRTIIECNQALVHITEEQPLLNEICKIIVTIGEYKLAWVGYAEHDEKKTVRPVAKAGFEEGYLDTLNITWADTERGRGPTGTAIRNGKYSICKDMLTNPNFILWRAEAIKRGYASSLALPLIDKGQTFGALNIYAAEPDAFDDEEVNLLTELADNLAFGITALRSLNERKQMEEKLQYFAYYDAITGLPNRTLFVDRLNHVLSRAAYHKNPFAVLAIDIDGFKSINDTFGFNVGDNVLKEVAGILSASVREGDTVARLGGDDFGMLLTDIAHSKDIVIVVEKIMKNISQPITVNGKEILLTLSMGISVYPHDGEEAHELMKNADLALSKAKKKGRKTYQFYTAGMNEEALEFVLMEGNLFNALKNEEFILYYQPYWEINTKKIAGMEALLRWQSKDLGLISPGRFIPVLEKTGMLIEVGEWIFRTACRQVKEWHDRGYPVPVSINLSPVQFRRRDFADTLGRIINESGVDPQLLTIEITESAFMEDIELTKSVLKKLKDIGVSISIDDFGTGYSSLSYLKRFPIDNLKIDISFIREIATDPDTASIVTAIISMAHSLNLKTIAEGIETEEQWKILRLLRCDMGQGYYFSKPLPAEDAEKLL